MTLHMQTDLTLMRCYERLQTRLAKERDNMKTARGGLDYQLDDIEGTAYRFNVSYQVNRFIGATLKGEITQQDDTQTIINGTLHNNRGYYLMTAVLLTIGIVATFARPEGFVALLGALGVIAINTFLVHVIRQGLVKLVKESVTQSAYFRDG